MPRNVTGTVHAYRQTSLLSLPHQLLGDPLGLTVAVIAVAGETVEVDVLFAEAHLCWEDPVGRHVMHGPGSVSACQAQDLARAPDVGGFQSRVRIHEVHNRPWVDDQVYLAGQRFEVSYVQAEEGFGQVPGNGHNALRPFGLPQPVAPQVGLDSLHRVPARPDEAVDPCFGSGEQPVEQEGSEEPGRSG